MLAVRLLAVEPNMCTPPVSLNNVMPRNRGDDNCVWCSSKASYIYNYD